MAAKAFSFLELRHIQVVESSSSKDRSGQALVGLTPLVFVDSGDPAAPDVGTTGSRHRR